MWNPASYRTRDSLMARACFACRKRAPQVVFDTIQLTQQKKKTKKKKITPKGNEREARQYSDSDCLDSTDLLTLWVLLSERDPTRHYQSWGGCIAIEKATILRPHPKLKGLMMYSELFVILHQKKKKIRRSRSQSGEGNMSRSMNSKMGFFLVLLLGSLKKKYYY